MIKNARRYSRQEILPEIGSLGQKKIAAARVLVVGAGGLGCPALLYLAGAGIGTIGIVDHDIIDVSNLQRQILYTTEDEGKQKAVIAKDRLLQLNPDIAIHAYPEELTEKNVLGLFSGYDVIIDGTDNFSTKFLINDAAVKSGKPVVYGAIQGFEGRVSVFDAQTGPCYRCLYPSPPESAILNCAEAGVVGALAGIIGSMQAMEAIKIIVSHAALEPLAGKLFLIDTRTMNCRTLQIGKRADCKVCSQKPADISLQSFSPVCSAVLVQEIDIADLSGMPDAVFVDVRELSEWKTGHIGGAQHLPLSLLQKNADLFSAPDKNRPCILYCQGGMRSRKAAEILLNAGYRDLFSLKGGYEVWCSLQEP